MTDAARVLSTQDAQHFHRWLQDDAVGLQLWETMDSWDAINAAPEPARARRWFVGLCLVRLSVSFRVQLAAEIEAFRRKPEWWETTGWIATRMTQVGLHPEEYPFSLSPAEWKYFQNKIFGGQVAEIRSFYHPPSFYDALAVEVLNDAASAVAAGVATFLVVGSDGEAAEILTAKRALLSGFAAAGERMLVPGVDPQAAQKHRLWPRYLDEARRRALA